MYKENKAIFISSEPETVAQPTSVIIECGCLSYFVHFKSQF